MIPLNFPAWFSRRIAPQPNGCWLWQGSYRSWRNVDWYGTVNHTKVRMYTHILAYELTHGRVPPGLELDHMCEERRCCNPAHLQAIPHSMNIEKGRSYTHCPQGHPRTAQNTKLRPNGTSKGCRICHNLRCVRRVKEARRRLALIPRPTQE